MTWGLAGNLSSSPQLSFVREGLPLCPRDGPSVGTAPSVLPPRQARAALPRHNVSGFYLPVETQLPATLDQG